MLYLFLYVLRVKYSGVGDNVDDDDFDVDDFIRRMTIATGLNVQGDNFYLFFFWLLKHLGQFSWDQVERKFL